MHAAEARAARTILFALIAIVCACQRTTSDIDAAMRRVVRRASRATLTAFESEQELADFLRSLARTQRGARNGPQLLDGLALCGTACASAGGACSATSPCCSGLVCSAGRCVAEVEEAPAPAAEAAEEPSAGTPPAESITNVQHAGVDEGGIVKLHGDHLVVLRRGRLFSIEIGKD